MVHACAPRLLTLDQDSIDSIVGFLEPRFAFTAFSKSCRQLRRLTLHAKGHYIDWNDGCGINAFLLATGTSEQFQGNPQGAFEHVAITERLLRDDQHLFRMSTAFARFRSAIAADLPGIHSAIRPGATRQDFNATFLENSKRTGRPEDKIRGDLAAWAPLVRVLYALVDGQDLDHGNDTGIYGSYIVYNDFGTTFALPANASTLCTRLESIFPLAMVHSRTGMRQLIAVSRGTVVSPATNEVFPPGAVLSIGVSMLQSAFGPMTGYLIAPSVEAWFTGWCNGVADGKYGLDPAESSPIGPHINAFPEFGDEVSVRTTHDIEVRMSPMLMASASMPTGRNTQSVFAYQVKMAMHRPTSSIWAGRSCRAKLRMRTWDCTDTNGHTETITGEGVIGLFPVLAPFEIESRPRRHRTEYEWTHGDDMPGNASEGWFTYVSRTSAANEETTMDGSFTFAIGDDLDGASADTIEVPVATCKFKAHIVTIPGARY